MLQVDGYPGFKALQRDRDDGAVVLAFCWAHLRRRFVDIHAATQSPIAAEALLRLAALYATEAGIHGYANKDSGAQTAVTIHGESYRVKGKRRAGFTPKRERR